MVKCTCLNCQGEFERRKIRKFCSNLCQSKFRQKENVTKWLNGEHDGVRGQSQTSTWIKTHLIEVRGHKCESCKHTKWLGQPINLELEHKDGDSSNNNPENLELLCPNCHSYTPTYKGRNKNSNRDRSRYYKRNRN